METKEIPIVRFMRWNCKIQKHKYLNNRTCLELIDAKTGEPIATATVNVPQQALAKDEVLIKDYSENEGMLKTLVKAGIVKDTGERVPTGMVLMPKVKLLI